MPKHTDKSPRKALLYTVIALLLLVILLLLRPEKPQPSPSSPGQDPNAAVGQYKGKSQEEIIAELNKIVEEGMFNISINSNITMSQGGEAELRIENIAANHHLMQVQITLNATGEAVYTSGLIEPGYYIQSVPLAIELPVGEYTATATFIAYDMDTEQKVGQAAAVISITVTE